jgi:hypothetical protein
MRLEEGTYSMLDKHVMNTEDEADSRFPARARRVARVCYRGRRATTPRRVVGATPMRRARALTSRFDLLKMRRFSPGSERVGMLALIGPKGGDESPP